MQPIVSPLPEFHRLRLQPVTAPKIRDRDGFVAELLGCGDNSIFQLRAIFDPLRLP